jgi:hypothetical protein
MACSKNLEDGHWFIFKVLYLYSKERMREITKNVMISGNLS